MTIRRAAMLALGFWLILRPPFIVQSLHPTKTEIDLEAPLRQWFLWGHIFDSASECEQARQKVIHNMGIRSPQFEERIQQALKKPLPHETIEGAKAEFERSVCVLSDDPRLKGK